MIIERTPSEFVIRLPINAQLEQMQDFIDYLRYKELTSGYRTRQQEVDELSRQINKNWRNGNKDKFSGARL